MITTPMNKKMEREKFEAWLCHEDAALVRMHMEQARIRGKAPFTRAALLSGNVPAKQRLEADLGQLLIAVQDLTTQMPALPEADRRQLATVTRAVLRCVRRVEQLLSGQALP